MSERRVELPKQLIVRVPAVLYELLRADAEANERTVSQSVRFHLKRALPDRQRQP